MLNLWAKLLCGGFAGAIAQSFACKFQTQPANKTKIQVFPSLDPFDVTRRRMQLAQMTPDMQHWG